MAQTIKDMESDLATLKGQLGAAFRYLEEVKADLLKEGYDLQSKPSQAIKDVKAARRLITRPLGRTERYVGRAEKHVAEDMAELEKYLPALLKKRLQGIRASMNPGLAALTEALSRFSGSLKDDMGKLKKLLEAKTPNNTQIVTASRQLLEKVKNLETWIQGLETTIRDYDALLEHIEKL